MSSQRPTDPAELTIKAAGLGIVLAFVFGAANAYLGMRAGQTVAATIPAAVIAMALFRLPFLRGTVGEQNIARTAASVGEALVAGAIFTIPAFVMVEIDGARLWSSLRDHYWEAVLILLAGGLIGVFFIILLRRALCVDAGLPWPESVACVELVRAGGESGEATRYVFGSMAVGGVVQFLKSEKSLHLISEYATGFWKFPRSVVAGAAHGGGVALSTPALSPALFGVGYLIGPELAAINVAGGLIAWWLFIPLLLFFDTGLTDAAPEALADQAEVLWRSVVRPIAVGAMLVAAANTMFRMRQSIWQSLRGTFKVSSEAAHAAAAVERTERDIPAKWVFLSTALLIVPITFLYQHFTRSWKAALLAGC